MHITRISSVFRSTSALVARTTQDGLTTLWRRRDLTASTFTTRALPRQRPTLALPNGIQSRKPSLNSASANSSAHPLRQTSYPPSDDLAARAQYSPSADGSLDDFGDDDDIRSAISGPAAGDSGFTHKRKRPGERGKVGRPSKRNRGGEQQPRKWRRHAQHQPPQRAFSP